MQTYQRTLCTKKIRQAKAMTVMAVFTTICLLISTNAMAMAVPAAGSFAYDLYDIGVNQILLGPIGFVAGVACMVFAAILAIRQMILPAAGVVMGGAFLLKADAVVQTVGAMII
ncbi:MAG: hypothetical protein GY799_06980 [Desulfobulbaceae bacterium]|nr:hypothetical protein [Desulfobulbaceae bacterium]